MTIDQILQLAVEHHQKGEFAQAEPLYRQVLAHDPNHVDAMCLLALLSNQRGDPRAAIELLRRAEAVAPDNPRVRAATAEAYSNLGDLLRRAGNPSEAIGAYRAALALRPEMAETANNLGLALVMSGRLTEALEAYRHAVAQRPGLAEAHNNLAVILQALRRFEEALRAAQEAIRHRAEYPEAYDAAGRALMSLGRVDEAAAAFETAVRLRPPFAEAWNDLGNARAALGAYQAAREAYQTAVRIRPDFLDAVINLGNLLSEFGLPEEAALRYRRALEVRPDAAAIHNNLGSLLGELGEPQQALAAFRRATELQPDFKQAWSNLLYASHFDPMLDGRAILEEHMRWARRFAEPLTAAAQPHDEVDRNPNRRLRIGYVSPDLRDHAVGRFMLPLLTKHDRERFEIYCYADVERGDGVTEHLRDTADVWRGTFGTPDDALAKQIRQDRVDILIDLAVHSAGNRMLVFARRPAPVQCTYLGYPGTTGMSAVQWRLTDRFLDPPEQDRPFYSERPKYLETTYWCYQPPAFQTPISPLPMLEGGHVTFGCLNSFAKVSRLAIEAWAQVLQRVPGSRLLVHAHRGSHREKVREVFRARGIADERVEFIAKTQPSAYFATYARIDVALDAFPYNGGTTTCDALWMDVPVVSIPGDIAVRRAGLSILSRVGLADLVASQGDMGNYLDIASELASDRDRLLHLRSTLRDRMRASPLLDATSFARDIEQCYREMWKDWCDR